MLYCARHGLSVPVPVCSRHGAYLHRVAFDDGKERAIRLLKYVPGRLFDDQPASTELLYQAGAFVQRFGSVLSVS